MRTSAAANEVTESRSGSDTANSRMKTRMGVVRVADSVGLPNEAIISRLNGNL